MEENDPSSTSDLFASKVLRLEMNAYFTGRLDCPYVYILLNVTCITLFVIINNILFLKANCGSGNDHCWTAARRS